MLQMIPVNKYRGKDVQIYIRNLSDQRESKKILEQYKEGFECERGWKNQTDVGDAC